MTRDEIIEKVAERLAHARRPFFLTGAGMGVASGLDTFRGAGGMWRNHRPEDLSSLKGFKNDPKTVWEWYNERIAAYLNAEPNQGHVAIARIKETLPTTTIVTQNVDGLQERAGADNVIEIHGSIFDLKCTGPCSNSEKVIGQIDGPFLGNQKSKEPYRHELCGGLLRPGVVFFGDQLPRNAQADAQHESMHADVIIVAGTSAQVQPAASLARPHDTSVMLVEINPEPVMQHKTGFVLAEGTETALPDIAFMVRDIVAKRSRGR